MITVHSSPAYVLLYHVIFLRIFTSLIPPTFRLYPDYSSISHSRFLSKNGDGVGIGRPYEAGGLTRGSARSETSETPVPHLRFTDSPCLVIAPRVHFELGALALKVHYKR